MSINVTVSWTKCGLAMGLSQMVTVFLDKVKRMDRVAEGVFLDA